MGKQAFLFDMDGTLIDSMDYWNNLKHRVCDLYFKRTGVKIVLSENELLLSQQNPNLLFTNAKNLVKTVKSANSKYIVFTKDTCTIKHFNITHKGITMKI